MMPLEGCVDRALQDLVQVHCFGCGALNEHGLQIKSFWAGEDMVCAWRPKPYHIGHPGILYGGLIASVVDCHCIWTTAAHACRRAGMEMNAEQDIAFVTGASASITGSRYRSGTRWNCAPAWRISARARRSSNAR
jgi:hypothetical protein